YLHWWFQVDYQDAVTGIEQALDIARAQDDPFEIAFCHLMSAYAMISTERYAEALPHLETSKALFDGLNEPYYVCWALHRLGYTYSNLNNRARSNAYTEQSLVLARATRNRLALVICLYNLGSDCILEGDYRKGRDYCEEALQVATEAEHQGQIAHSLSLLALCAFCEGDYATAQAYAERSHFIIEDINLLVFQSYNQAVLILLACFRADYGEALRLKESGRHQSTNVMGYQLLYWSFALLACGLGDPAEARLCVQKVLQLTNSDGDHALIAWLVPGAAYALAETDREKAVELLAWVWDYPDKAVNWVREWSVFSHVQGRLRDSLGEDDYQSHWAQGKMLSYDAVSTYLRREFQSFSESTLKSLLTAREMDILRLLAAGLTNPQIAEQLVIGAGTVKTHTLNIYRKLEVANRTQAIVRAQELGLLPPEQK
ncbi:MAG: LuxR C-terminal-related transcriptional regulator, partial [Anaerolineae bacterium]|nr:LuxR C-terminal-related transcriptional regulator [Anaerolineae bacterium]